MKLPRRQDGYTLVEVLLALSMATVIFGATLAIVVGSLHSEQASTQRNSAQDQGRLAIDLIARQLRNISSPISSPKLVERAGPYDLVFQTVDTPSGPNVGGAQRPHEDHLGTDRSVRQPDADPRCRRNRPAQRRVPAQPSARARGELHPDRHG